MSEPCTAEPGCCTDCGGTGRAGGEPCWDCRGTGHPHAPAGGDGRLWRDRAGDVWELRGDGLMHTPETKPFPWAYVDRKWGPLVEVGVAVVPTPLAD